MTNKRKTIFMWILAILPALILLAVYPRLPDIVPTNFGFDGSVNSYGPKTTLWIFGAINILLLPLFRFLPRVDPKRQNYVKFQKYYDLFIIVFELFMLLVLCLVLLEILKPGVISIGRGITALVSLLFLFLGNMMGKIKHNYFMGVKTPWTLADPEVWARTHRLCGRLWFLLGLLLLPCCLLLPEKVFFFLLVGGIFLSVAVVFLYSYLCFRKLHPV